MKPKTYRVTRRCGSFEEAVITAREMALLSGYPVDLSRDGPGWVLVGTGEEREPSSTGFTDSDFGDEGPLSDPVLEEAVDRFDAAERTLETGWPYRD